jgi:hypothetical protein
MIVHASGNVISLMPISPISSAIGAHTSASFIPGHLLHRKLLLESRFSCRACTFAFVGYIVFAVK